MIKCDIAGIHIGLIYRYQAFFKDNIDHYEKHLKTVNHILETKYYNENIKLSDTLNNRILAGDEKHIKTLLTYDHDFKHATIHIDERKFKTETLAHAEYIYMSMIFLEIAYLYQFFPMHGSAIVYKNEALIVSAPSGTGKSTHTKLWSECYPKDVFYINDDKPLIKAIGDKLYVYGTPFSGAHTKNTNMSYPLKALVFLSQGLTNTVKATNSNDAIIKIMRNSLRPNTNEHWDETLSIVDLMMDKLTIIDIDATLSYDAVYAVKEAIFGDKP